MGYFYYLDETKTQANIWNLGKPALKFYIICFMPLFITQFLKLYS